MNPATVMPIIAACIGAIVAIMLGMALGKLNDIREHLEKLNGKFYTHVTNSNVHEAGFSKTDEQIKSLTNIVKIAHERLDRMERVS